MQQEPPDKLTNLQRRSFGNFINAPLFGKLVPEAEPSLYSQMQTYYHFLINGRSGFNQ